MVFNLKLSTDLEDLIGFKMKIMVDITNAWGTFESRLEHRGRFGGQQDASSIFVEGAALLTGHY